MNNLSVGNTLQGGKYKIIRFISSGGFGCTYEAEHTLLHKRVAIKEFFIKDFCNRDSNTMNVSVATESKRGLVDKLRRKFCDEAVAISKFSHPNIVKVYDVFEEHNTYYYVMDYLTGGSLKDIIKQNGHISESEATAYILQLCDALRYVHENNCLHLDIKPGNVMLDNNGRVVLIDFGAAKQYDEENGENTSSLVGRTPGYAPIEQMGNNVRKFSPATDVYSVGATYYSLLTGKTPPAADVILDEGFPKYELQRTGISEGLIAVLSKAMSVGKSGRYQNVDQLIAAIEKIFTLNDIDAESTFVNSAKDLNEIECEVQLDSKKFKSKVVHDDFNHISDNIPIKNKSKFKFFLLCGISVTILILLIITIVPENNNKNVDVIPEPIVHQNVEIEEKSDSNAMSSIDSIKKEPSKSLKHHQETYKNSVSEIEKEILRRREILKAIEKCSSDSIKNTAPKFGLG